MVSFLTKVIILLVLELKRVCSTDELVKITGLSKGYIINVLIALRKEGLVKSMRYNKTAFLLLGLPLQNPASSKTKFHTLTKPLAEIVNKNPSFGQEICDFFQVRDFNELKQELSSVLRREGLLTVPLS